MVLTGSTALHQADYEAIAILSLQNDLQDGSQWETQFCNNKTIFSSIKYIQLNAAYI